MVSVGRWGMTGQYSQDFERGVGLIWGKSGPFALGDSPTDKQ